MSTKNRVFAVITILVLGVVLIACSGPAQASPATGAVANHHGGAITVVGSGEAFGEPDIATVQVGVDIFADTVSEATKQNEDVIQQIMETVTELGIDATDIQTTNYSLWAEQNYSDRGPEGIAGYRVSNMVNITIRNIDTVGDVLAAATDAGANAVHGIYFSVSDPASLEAEARETAVADARARAESLASLSGVTLGDVTMISEVVGQSPMPFAGGGFDMAVAESMAAPTVSPGQLSHNVQIQVTFSIQ